MSHVGYQEYGATDINEGIVETPMFTIKAPRFPDEDQYGFIWDYIKDDQDSIVNYVFG